MKLVRINSSVNVFVYGTGFSRNTPNANSDFNVNASTWLGTKVLIKQGIHTYPAEIAEWSNVKALEAKAVLSISPCADGEPETEDDKTAVVKTDELKKEEVVQNRQEKLLKKRNETMKTLATTIVEKEMMKNGDKE